MKSICDFRLLIACSFVAGLVGCHAGLHPYIVAGSSMDPAYKAGDRMFADQNYYSEHAIADEDIVIFRHHDNILIKRVSALPGETIEARNGVLFRNGRALAEPYAHHVGHAVPEMETFEARVVPKGELFLTGDNRDLSLDSRIPEFGVVHTADVIGKASLTYWPAKR